MFLVSIKHRRPALFLLVLFIVVQPLTYGQVATDPDAATFDKLFAIWTDAFNRKDLIGACKLFSPDCIASSPDDPSRNYSSIRTGFKKLFALKDKIYQYKYKIHNIYRSGDLATVRITWYLKIYDHDKLISESQEQGIDIFKRNKIGKWEIVNFIAYSEKSPKH
jgi:ketosteroid isomerase-like protein